MWVIVPAGNVEGKLSSSEYWLDEPPRACVLPTLPAATRPPLLMLNDGS